MTENLFTVGPAHPVTDSRELPAVTAEEELEHVGGANEGTDHPDNTDTDELRGTDGDGIPDEDEPSEDELDALLADVDPDDVDGNGYDDNDVPYGEDELPEGIERVQS